jgi:hypothetical protein
MHSHFVENYPIRILEDGPSFLRWLCHINIADVNKKLPDLLFTPYISFLVALYWPQHKFVV